MDSKVSNVRADNASKGTRIDMPGHGECIVLGNPVGQLVSGARMVNLTFESTTTKIVDSVLLSPSAGVRLASTTPTARTYGATTAPLLPAVARTAQIRRGTPAGKAGRFVVLRALGRV